MKIKRILTISAIAVMAIGAMGFASSKVHAQSGAATAPQVQATEVPESAQPAADTDTAQVQDQSGSQNETTGTADSKSVAAETASEAPETSSSDGKDAVPSGTPSISADAALKAAQDYLKSSASGTAVLDDENGTLVYSVDLNGSDVKVNATSGAVLGVDEVGGSQVDFGN